MDSPAIDQIREYAKQADIVRHEYLTNHPNNGTVGWWYVDGIRHYAYTQATSALEAIERANDAELVDSSWEAPMAYFIGQQLPETFGSGSAIQELIPDE